MIVPLEERAAVHIYTSEERLVIACAPMDLRENEVLAEAEDQQPSTDGERWTTYGVMSCPHTGIGGDRRHWFLTREPLG